MPIKSFSPQSRNGRGGTEEEWKIGRFFAGLLIDTAAHYDLWNLAEVEAAKAGIIAAAAILRENAEVSHGDRERQPDTHPTTKQP